MAVVVVGGSAKGVGKTAVVCAVIGVLKDVAWTAVKVTSHEHGKAERTWEETEAGDGSDTARFLAAGARRALLVTAGEGEAPVWESLGGETNLIIESNAAAGRIRADLCLAVIGRGERKQSFQALWERADAEVSLSEGEDLMRTPALPRFNLKPDGQATAEMAEWLRAWQSDAAGRGRF